MIQKSPHPCRPALSDIRGQFAGRHAPSGETMPAIAAKGATGQGHRPMRRHDPGRFFRGIAEGPDTAAQGTLPMDRTPTMH